MKKVELRTMETNIVLLIKLGITIRQVNRLIQIYKSYGKAGFVHGNRGRLPKKAISQDIKKKILELYKSKYFDANFKHFQELLEEYEHISISYTALYTLFRKVHILSPKVRKETIK